MHIHFIEMYAMNVVVPVPIFSLIQECNKRAALTKNSAKWQSWPWALALGDQQTVGKKNIKERGMDSMGIPES